MRVFFAFSRSRILQSKRQQGWTGWHELWDFSGWHERDPYVILDVPKILLVVGLTGLTAWIGAAIALTVWLNREPPKLVKFVDVVWPGNWDDLRVARGQISIEQGMEDWKAGRVLPAYKKLQIGLNRNPGNSEARAFVARVVYSNAPERGVAMMEEGVELARKSGGKVSPPKYDYWVRFFEMLRDAQAYAKILAVTQREMDTPEFVSDAALRKLVIDARADALVALGRYDELLDFSRKMTSRFAPKEAYVHRELQALMGLKRYDETLAAVEMLLKDFADNVSLYQLQADGARLSGNEPLFLSTLRSISVLFDDKTDSWIFICDALYRDGNLKLAAEYRDEFLEKPCADNVSLLRMALVSNQYMDAEGIRACLRVAEKRGAPLQPFRMLLVQSLTYNQQWLEAEAVWREYKAASEGKSSDLPPLVNAFFDQVIAFHVQRATPEAATHAITRIFERRSGPLPFMQRSSRLLQRMGLDEAAIQMLRIAKRDFPFSRAVTEDLAALEARRPARLETASVRRAEAQTADVYDEAMRGRKGLGGRSDAESGGGFIDLIAPQEQRQR